MGFGGIIFGNPKWLPSLWRLYGIGDSIAVFSPVANDITFTPFYLLRPMSISKILVSTTSASVTLRAALYNALGAAPNKLVAQTTADLTSTVLVENLLFTLSQPVTLDAGLAYLGVQVKGPTINLGGLDIPTSFTDLTNEFIGGASLSGQAYAAFPATVKVSALVAPLAVCDAYLRIDSVL